MPHSTETRERAKALRAEGFSLAKIAQELSISKGTASLWLRDMPLPEEELRKRYSEGAKKAPATRRNIYRKGPQSRISSLAPDPSGFTTQRKGKIAEAAALHRMVLLDFEVYGSPFDGDKADWVVRAPGGDLAVVQVKWATHPKKGSPTLKLRAADGRGNLRPYEEGEFDYLVGYDLWSDTCYVWTWDEVKHLKSAVSITDTAAERWDKFSST